MDLCHPKDTPLDVWCKLIDIQFLTVICQKYCSGILPHSPVCIYWSTRNSAYGVSHSNDCITSVAETSQEAKYYSICDSYSELQSTDSCSAVKTDMVFSDFYCDGYLINTFELQVMTTPSLIGTTEYDFTHDIHTVHPDIKQASHASAETYTCELPLQQHSTHRDEVFTFQSADDCCDSMSSVQYDCEASPSSNRQLSSLPTDHKQNQIMLSSRPASAKLLLQTHSNHNTHYSDNTIGISQCYLLYCACVFGVVPSTTVTRIGNLHEQSKIFDPGILSLS